MNFYRTGTHGPVSGSQDSGPRPLVVNISQEAVTNSNFRTVLWTGEHLQLTLMSIPPGGEVGLELHPATDQFFRIESGRALVLMGSCKDCLDFKRKAGADFAILIPAGTWHNIINTGQTPLKLYSIYAPPHHPHGVIHRTKADSDASE